MELTKISVKNFKGINYLEFDLSKSPHNNVYTLVGINESGKTTILEAINFFEFNDEKDLLDIKIKLEDIIPIRMKTNFNDIICIKSFLSLNDNDNRELRDFLQEKFGYLLEGDINTFSVAQNYSYEYSKYKKVSFTWDINLNVKKRGERKYKSLYNINKNEWLEILGLLKTKMPKILYFPTAFFDLPNRICLTNNNENEKNHFFQLIIQDILDSMDQGLNIDTHIIKRMNDGELVLVRQLCKEMNKKINDVILYEWKKVLNDTQYSINVEVYKDEDGAFLEFNVDGPDGIFKISERSLGFRWFFVFLLLTQFRGFRKNENRHIIFMFDEPAANLSNKAQKQLLNSLERISNKCTIIYTTHSHHLVNPNWLEGAHVVSNEALGNGDMETFSSKNTDIKLERYRNFANDHPQNVSYFQPILDILEYVPNDLDMSCPSVIVEGKNDFYTLKYFFEIQNGLDDIYFVPGMSCSNVSTLISLFSTWGKQYMVLLDSDTEAIKSKNEYINKFGRIIENKIYTLKDIDQTWDKSVMESLLSNSKKLEIQRILFPSKKYSKNVYNKAIQELLMTRKKIDIELDILESFRKIHRFIKSKFT